MSNDEGMTKHEQVFVIRTFEFVSIFVIRISSFPRMPGAEHLRFTLRREACFRMRLSLLGKRFEPRESVACRELKGSKR